MRQNKYQQESSCAGQSEQERRVYEDMDSLKAEIAQAEEDLKKLQEQDPEWAARMEQDAARNYSEILKKIQERKLKPAGEADSFQD